MQAAFGHASEFYTIELETEKVTKLPIGGLGKEAILTSLVTLHFVIYVIGLDRSNLPEEPYIHRGVSYVDLRLSEQGDRKTDADAEEERSFEWKAAPPSLVNRPRIWWPRGVAMCGKIYVFTGKVQKVEVFDPKLNQWSLLSPPRGFKDFSKLQRPTLADHSNNRLLVSLREGDATSSSSQLLYAYYPHRGWKLLLPDFYTSSSCIRVVQSGVVFCYSPVEGNHHIFDAFDVDSKQSRKLNITYTSNVDSDLWCFDFDELLNLGKGILCLVGSGCNFSCDQTFIFAIQFKVKRTTPTDLLITPFPGKFISLQEYCYPLHYSTF